MVTTTSTSLRGKIVHQSISLSNPLLFKGGTSGEEKARRRGEKEEMS